MIIKEGPKGECEYCGEFKELRPYGKHGERICAKCGRKDVETTEAHMGIALGFKPKEES